MPLELPLELPVIEIESYFCRFRPYINNIYIFIYIFNLHNLLHFVSLFVCCFQHVFIKTDLLLLLLLIFHPNTLISVFFPTIIYIQGHHFYRAHIKTLYVLLVSITNVLKLAVHKCF